MSMVTLHRYPLESCGHKPGQRGYPTAATLLSQDVLTGNIKPLRGAVRLARKHHFGVRITETNSVTCGGAVGLSDRFASSLWSIDWMFNLAAIGVQGVNFHESSPLYQAFRTGYREGYFAVVKPLYYGMLFFANAAPHHARLLPSTYYAARVRKGLNIKVWGTVDKVDKVVRVAFVNKGLRGGPAVVKIPFAHGSATLERLRAPSILANTGVTFAGQGFALPSRDGLLQGDHVDEQVRRRSGSTYRFTLPGASAALLTVPVSSTRARQVLRP